MSGRKNYLFSSLKKNVFLVKIHKCAKKRAGQIFLSPSLAPGRITFDFYPGTIGVKDGLKI